MKQTNDIADARRYVLSFGDKFLGRKISYCDTSAGRRIYFYNMTDEDAVLVAGMLKEIELEAKK